jgi:hydroxymethylglutaryl-CoA lyase
MPDRLRIVEVGPRDGLQNEKVTVSVDTRLGLIALLREAGLKTIEVGSFVSPKRIPQMADTDAVVRGLDLNTSIRYPVLVPNAQGMTAALAAGVREIAIFASASETFSHRNINCSIEDSIQRFQPVVELAAANGIAVRGYVSCVLGCPYEGDVAVDAVVAVSRSLSDLGCYEISLGDTIGVGTPKQARDMVRAVAGELAIDQLAVHFHDTRGQALANIKACLEEGISVVDSAVGGLGGCPCAPGAAGNVSTESLVCMLDRMGIATGVDLGRVAAAGQFISAALGKTYTSISAQSMRA